MAVRRVYSIFRPDGNKTLMSWIKSIAGMGYAVVQVFSNGAVNPSDMEGFWILAVQETVVEDD